MNFDHIQTVEDVRKSSLTPSTEFAANSGTTHELIVNCVHPLLLRAKAAVNIENKPIWWETMSELFADKY